MIKIINQRNPRYSNLELGTSGVYFTNFGCITAAFKAGYEDLTGKDYTADQIVEKIDYTDKKRYPDLEAGLVIYNEKKFSKMGVEVERVFRSPNDDLATEYTKKLKNRKGFMVVAIDNNSHFVLMRNWSLKWVPWFLADDSWRKNIYCEKGIRHAISKSRISGYLLADKL